ncbi:pilus assembly protein TadG-related protein [Sphingomonas arenae]|uniref:pilus assembly protein TadG-related protein n=1 Tax=Sphingomonas arenae TaxID=2812555 RepID=UPI0019689381|nr:pilus assembly protein TadG-related protein [Sphingomonas arenae]
MLGGIRRLGKADEAAVAPTVALSLFALIAAGGIAFDYARMASLDTELQNAADQAALAAASQLDGQAGAIQRAEAAARGLLANQTRFGNDGGGINVAVDTATGAIVFYANKADAEADTNSFTAVTEFARAKFVKVRVAPRDAVYTLTPVVRAFRATMGGEAVAGLGTSICKTPPVMICNPDEVNANSDFDANSYRGRGLKLTSVGGGNGSWAPGNFGYLNTGGGSNGVPGLQEALGWVTPPGECIEATGVDTKPGANTPATDAVNTRFDIYDSNSSCQTGGTCPASINSVKDVVRPANASGNNACAIHNQGWQEGAVPYLPSSAATPLPTTVTPTNMGHPRDMCHAYDESCASGRIGDAKWDRDAYFRTNYRRSDGTYWTNADWQFNTGLTENVAKTRPTRYEVYKWEMDNRDTVIDGVTVLGQRPPTASGATLVSHGKPVCSPVEGYGSGTVPTGNVVDRRRFTVAVVNCTANSVNGNSTNVPVRRWIDVFVVEPSLNRGADARTIAGTAVKRVSTGQGDLYVEIIGETSSGGSGSTNAQVVRRDVPYLIR